MLALPSKSNVIYLVLEPNVGITFSGQNASTDDHHDGLNKVCPNDSRKTSSDGEDASNTLKFLSVHSNVFHAPLNDRIWAKQERNIKQERAL